MGANGGIKWDSTVNAGSVIAMCSIVAAVIGGAWVMSYKVDTIMETMKDQGNRFENRIGKVEESINLIREDLARNERIAVEIEELKKRVDRMEGRG